MKKYEYQFIEVPLEGGLRAKPGDTFNACKTIIQSQALQGWRLSQVVVPINEKSGVNTPRCYQIIFEREVE